MHTPGPWKPDFASEALWVRTSDGSGICMTTWIGGRHGLSNRRKAEEVEANARLIAAAPDLLAALKSLVAWAEEKNRWHKNEWGEVFAAIAKAEGAPSPHDEKSP